MNSYISGRVFLLMTDGGLYKVREEIRPKLRGQQLSFPYLITFLSGMNKNTYYDKAYTHYTKNYPDNRGKLFKEITCQSNGKNGLTQITDKFRNKFSTRFINNFHQFNFIIINKRCQGETSNAGLEEVVVGLRSRMTKDDYNG